MEYTGPATLSDPHMDLTIHDENAEHQHWPPLSSSPTAAIGDVASGAAASTSELDILRSGTRPKRNLEENSDSGDEALSPAAKTSKPNPTSLPTSTSYTQKQPSPQQRAIDNNHTLTPPAFAPRAEYVKLAFREKPSVETKLRWLADVNRTFHLNRNLAEVKMAAVTSRFVYIARSRQDIIERVTKGEFISLFLDVQDSPERSRKYPSYLVTRYPIDVDPSLAVELPGVYSARRFRQNGVPINRLVVTWNLYDPPPSTFSFSFLPCLPDCEIRRMRDDQPVCYRCWEFGHISRYCKASEKCAWCAGEHDSRSCQHRADQPPPPPPASSTSATINPSTITNAQWKCPRCKEQGVTVWHGCTKRRPTQQQASPPPPPPPPHALTPATQSRTQEYTASTATDSQQMRELREAIASLTTRYKLLSDRYDAFEARMTELAAKQASTDIKLNTLVEGQQSMIATFTMLAEKFDAMSTRLEKIETRTLSSSPPSPGTHSDVRHATSSTNSSRKTKKRVQ